MDRRSFLGSALAALGAWPMHGLAAVPDATGVTRAVIGASWRGPAEGAPHYAGALDVDWQQRTVGIRYALELPTRPHGLTPEPDGGLLVVGVRPGTWLTRCDDAGRMVRHVRVDEEPGSCRLNGHSVASADGRVLFTTETDQASGRGRIGVRDRETLRKLDEWDSLGVEPHQLLLDAEGHLMVANGGIPRTAADRKHSLDRMDSSLVRLDARSGRALGQWRLEDPRMSLRHLAWSTGPSGETKRLGIALQAEHDEPERRRNAPVLAVWENDSLSLPAQATDGAGYAGDIAPAFDGGFVVSSNKAGRAMLWHPVHAPRLATVA
ncbi:MAG TPA: DUF1513 domain-containing protein, partial [Quisquiliibacterium sp.]|nr:DUF1513 domain-containing protein [Quisquiliibacterium sp.]